MNIIERKRSSNRPVAYPTCQSVCLFVCLCVREVCCGKTADSLAALRLTHDLLSCVSKQTRGLGYGLQAQLTYLCHFYQTKLHSPHVNINVATCFGQLGHTLPGWQHQHWLHLSYTITAYRLHASFSIPLLIRLAHLVWEPSVRRLSVCCLPVCPASNLRNYVRYARISPPYRNSGSKSKNMASDFESEVAK